MKGTADITVTARVELTGGESAHLEEVIRQVNVDSKARLQLNMADKDLLRRFADALGESNEEASKLFQRLNPIEEAVPEPF